MAYQSYENTKQKFRKAWEKNQKNTDEITKLTPRYPYQRTSLASKYLYKIDTSLDALKDMSDRYSRGLEQGYTEEEIALPAPFTKVLIQDTYPQVDLTVEFELNNFPEYLLPYINIRTYVSPVGDVQNFLYNGKLYPLRDYFYNFSYNDFSTDIQRLSNREYSNGRYDYLVSVYFRAYGYGVTSEKGVHVDRNVAITLTQNHFSDAYRKLR